jgi:hypothetical protein
MVDLIEFKTPSGYVFYLKPEMTYGEFLEVQKVVTAKMEFDMTTQEAKNFQASALFDAQEKTLSYLVKRAITPEGKEITNLTQAIKDLPRSDGEALMIKINEITQDNAVDEKKRDDLLPKSSEPTSQKKPA